MFHSLEVTAVRPQTRDAVQLDLRVPDALAERFRYVQGQHLTLRATIAGVEERRSYSICSPVGASEMSVAIKRVEGGAFSTWATRELKAGDVLEAMPPSGAFHTPSCSTNGRRYVAFAAGSGITPILSIITTALTTEPDSEFTLIYGNRSSSSVIFRDELGQLKDRFMARFNLVHILSREQQDIALFHGRIDQARTEMLLQQWVDPRRIDIAYICGPLEMIDVVTAVLVDHGVPSQAIRVERFADGDSRIRRFRSAPTGTAASVGAQCAVTVIQDGHSRHFSMPRGQDSVLDGALGQGIELPYSCRAGVCSTCRCKRTEGQIEMDNNFALEDYEVARGFMLACQSFPVSDSLTIDFDAVI